jgi:hypothetical protein
VCKRHHYLLGIPLVVLTAVTGTSVFATISATPQRWFQLLIGGASVTAAVLGALQTFLRPADEVAAHRSAAAAYSALRRTLEQRRVQSSALPDDALDGARERFADLADRSPVVPPRVWERTCRRLGAR